MPRTYISGERFEWDDLFAPLIGYALVITMALIVGAALIMMWAGPSLSGGSLTALFLGTGATTILVASVLGRIAYRSIEGMARGCASGYWTAIMISGTLALFGLWLWSRLDFAPLAVVGGASLLYPLAWLTGLGPRPI